MRYAFVFIGVLAIWIAGIMIATSRPDDANLVYLTIMATTLVLFIIGFKRGRK